MGKQEIIEQAIEFVKENSQKEGSHDFWHSYRVWKLSKRIAKSEECDEFIVELAALLHDIDDWKFGNNNKVEKWLENRVKKETVEKIKEIIESLSFKGANVKTEMKSIEGKIVQDADRLDAIGAIGIARAFAYGGYKQRMLYNPEEKPKMHNSFEEYKKSNSCTINHFYEKLLLLKDRMNTKTGKEIAEKRHKFMLKFLEEFFNEWEGKT